jgi:O-antigen biosynthesis protein
MNLQDDACARYVRWLEEVDGLYAKLQPPTESKCFSLLLVVPNGRLAANRVAVTLRSIADQTCTNFEVNAIVGGEHETELRQMVIAAGLQERVLLIEASTCDLRAQLAKCRGDFVSVIQPGVVLKKWALAAVERLAGAPATTADFYYADHDYVTADSRIAPMFKPAWSPVFLEHFNYIGDLWFAARPLIMRTVVEVAASSLTSTHRFLLELGRRATAVCHLPTILHSSPDETRAPDNRISRVNPTSPDCFPPHRKVSIIVPTCLADLAVFERCLDTLVHLTAYPFVEILIVFNNLRQPVPPDWINRWPVNTIDWSESFNWAAMNNRAAAKATGDLFLFLNDDVEVMQADWLTQLIMSLDHSGVGAVGPLMTLPDGSIQHVGINFVYSGGGARHLFHHMPPQACASWLTRYPREVGAITGACMLVSKQNFQRLGGFDETFAIVSNDTDFCIRLREEGLSVLVNPSVKLIHHEGKSRAELVEMPDVLRFWDKWETFLGAGDHFWNPNLDASRDDWIVDDLSVTLHSPRMSR